MSNLNELANELSDDRIVELVTSLGSDEYVDTDNAIIFKTVCHHYGGSDGSLKLYYYKQNKKFHCFTQCGCNFNIYGLFERHYAAIGKNYDFFNDILLPIYGDKIYLQKESSSFVRYESDFSRLNQTKISVNRTTINESLLNVFTFYPTVEWLNNGISIEAMKHYNILYSIDNNRIIIPHYDENGFLIGVRARALNKEDIEFGKYRPVKIEGQLLNHQLGYNLYGLNLVKDNIRKTKMAIVAEGEKSALQYETMFGKENNICVAACGSNFSQYQLRLLQKYNAEQILIAFDNQEIEWNKKELYYKKLWSLCGRYKNLCRIGFIWDTKNLLGLKDSPFDRGKEIFLELYKGAVWL